MNGFVFLSMIFLHILDDFHLQGRLIDMKQISWWRKQTEDPKYKNDYLVALFIHSFSWSFVISLPILHMINFEMNTFFKLIFIENIIIHAYIDDLKANKFKINLVEDQSVHILQICVLFLLYYVGLFNI